MATKPNILFIFDAETIQRGREGYYACVDFVDDCIGELLAGLEGAGLLDNTIVIYTSDHGEMLGEHGMWGKSIYYEESIMIPMLMTGPGIAAGHHRVAAPISLLDLYPTTAALAGLPVPEDLDGVDMSAILADPVGAATPRSCAPSSYYTYGVVVHGRKGPDDEPNRAFRLVRNDRWKYIDVERGAQLLFDLDNDPRETANLAAEPEHKERCDRMAAELAWSFDWDEVHLQLVEDRARREEQMSGQKPSTPNQYMLPDGRIFDAEAALYEARWLHVPPDMDGGIIPQQWG